MFDPADFKGVILAATAVAALLCLVAAAIEDAWRYRISNALVSGVVASFAIFAVVTGSWAFAGWSLGAGLCVLAAAALLFALGTFGGGDAKLMAAIALWTQFAGLPRFLLVMSAFGGILGIMWIVRRRMARSGAPAIATHRFSSAADDAAGPSQDSADPSGPTAYPAGPQDAAPLSVSQPAPPFGRLPYGIAIAAGGIDFFLFAPTSPLSGVIPF